MIEYKVNIEDEGKRFDNLFQKLTGESRSQAKKMIDAGKAMVNNKKKKPGYKVKLGDLIVIETEKSEDQKIEKDPENTPIFPEAVHLDIIYEDKYLMIINKPAGMVVHPAPGNEKGTLVNALLHYTEELSTAGGKFRPGIVHRLDKDTTGIMLIAKDDETHSYFKDKFKSREITKDYLTFCYGDYPEEKGIIESPIGRHPVERKKMTVAEGGRFAATKVKVLRRFLFEKKVLSYLKATPVTGRTHQIRVHLAHSGFPILGDTTYGSKDQKKMNKKIYKFMKDFEGQALHAFRLKFYHPYKEKEMSFRAPLPVQFKALIRWLNGGYK